LNYGSIVQVRSPSIAHLHLTPYTENVQQGGGLGHNPGSNVGEFQGLFCTSREYLFRPWVYPISPQDGMDHLDWAMRFSAKNAACPGAGKSVKVVADKIGITDQYIDTTNFYQAKAINLKGKTLPNMGAYEVKLMTTFPRGIDLDELDSRYLHLSCTLLERDGSSAWQAVSETNGILEKLPDGCYLTAPTLRIEENASGEVKPTVYLAIINMSGADVVMDPNTDAKAWFKINIRTGEAD
jgi:hypothetical protein